MGTAIAEAPEPNEQRALNPESFLTPEKLQLWKGIVGCKGAGNDLYIGSSALGREIAEIDDITGVELSETPIWDDLTKDLPRRPPGLTVLRDGVFDLDIGDINAGPERPSLTINDAPPGVDLGHIEEIMTRNSRHDDHFGQTPS